MYIFVLLISLLFLAGLVTVVRAVWSQKALSWQRRLYALIALSWVFVFITGLCGYAIGRGVSSSYGGFTYLGKIENGKHFVGDRGSYTEVTAEEWQYLQRVERIFGEHWWWLGAVGALAFALMGVLCEFILGPLRTNSKASERT